MKNPSLDIFIPVYREARPLKELLKALVDDPYPNKKIFVIVDEPTKKTIKTLKNFKTVKIIINRKRKGKVVALNEAAKRSKADVFLFIDSDVEIKSKNFISTVAREIKHSDILDINYEGKREKSLLTKLAYYEFLSVNMVSSICSKVKRCFGINGAILAMKRSAFNELKGFRRVIYEDLDIGLRSFLHEKKFKYVNEAKVVVRLFPSGKITWRKWFKQRKRWSIGVALWIKEYYKQLLKAIRKYPMILMTSVLFLLPAIVPLLVNLLISNNLIYKIIMLSSPLFGTNIGPLLFIPPFTFLLLKNIIATLVPFFIFSCVFYFFARKLNFKFYLHEFFVYYFFYCPLWLFIMVYGLLQVFILKKDERIISEWKV
jgi:cellulose synthase/poly-beta-1,6-N-acetylglucosamine synthase-like glycosyltransferase